MLSPDLLENACREYGHDCPMSEAISIYQLLKELVAMENLSGAFDYEIEEYLAEEQLNEARHLISELDLERDYSEYLGCNVCEDSD